LSVVWPTTTMLRKRGGGASTGSVSMTGLTRTTEITRRSSSIARRRYHSRSPRFDPRAMATEEIASAFRDVDVIAQLVDVAGGGRKILPEMLAGGLDRFDNAVCEFAILEATGESRGDVVPEPGRYFLVNPAITENDEALLLAGDEKKDAVAQLGPGHAEALEGFFSLTADVGSRFRLHMDADLA